MAAPPGFDPNATVLPDPGSSAAPMHVMRGGSRGGFVYSPEDEEMLSQYGLGPGGKIEEMIDAPTKAAFLEQIKSGKCAKGTGDLVILQKDCWAVVKVIRALIRSSMRGGGEQRGGQRGGGWLDTLLGRSGGAAAASAADPVKPSKTTKYPWARSFTSMNDFKTQINTKITELMGRIRSNPAELESVLNTYRQNIQDETNKYNAGLQAQLLFQAAYTITHKSELSNQLSTPQIALVKKFSEDMFAHMKQIAETIGKDRPSAAAMTTATGNSTASGRMDLAATLGGLTNDASGVSEGNVNVALAEIPAAGGGGAAEAAGGAANATVPSPVAARPPLAPIRTPPAGAGTGLGVVPSTVANAAGTSTPEASPRLAPGRAPARRAEAAAAAAAENDRITSARQRRNNARTARNAAKTALNAEGFVAHKVRPVWLRENVTERSLPIHYNLKEGKWRGNMKEGLSFYSIYGDNPELIVGKYRTIKTRRANLNRTSKNLKNAESALQQAELTIAQEKLAVTKAETERRKANAARRAAELKAETARRKAEIDAEVRAAEAAQRESQQGVRAKQTLGQRFKSFFGRGGKRKTRRAERKSRRANTRRNRK